jgi:hypothetical protein
MLTRYVTAVAAALIVLGAASTSLAKNRTSLAKNRGGGGPPTVDIQKTCRENTAALGTALGSDIGQDLNVCLMDEQAARDQIVKDWATYPAIAKARCVQPYEYLPGYVEWQTCLEMTRDVVKMRQDREKKGSAPTTVGQSSKRRVGPATSDCPVVKYTEDGGIEYITNCPGPGMPGIDVNR